MIIWLNGRQVQAPVFIQAYIIVHGCKGVGKSIFCKYMSLHNHNMFYVEVQQLNEIELKHRLNAVNIIEIRKVK